MQNVESGVVCGVRDHPKSLANCNVTI